jgi:hypothetical protein
MLELDDAIVVDAGLLEMLSHLLPIGSREESTDGEEVALNGHEDFIDARHRLDGAREADCRVQLIDVAIGFDARMALRNSATAEKSSITGIAGASVDANRWTGNGELGTGSA